MHFFISFLFFFFFFGPNDVHAMACWRIGSYAPGNLKPIVRYWQMVYWTNIKKRTFSIAKLTWLSVYLWLSTFLLKSSLDIVLFIIFFPPKKKLHRDTYRKTFRTIMFDISKDVPDSQPVLDLWPFTELFNILQKALVSRSSQKPLTLYAWKFIYNKILISWGYCTFVVRVRWTVRELLPLKLYNFYVKI
jgi:hypothetical protein